MKPVREHSGRWVLATFVPLGLATWAAFAYAGTQARVGRWKLYAVAYFVLVYGGFVLSTVTKRHTTGADIAGGLLVLPWVFGIGHALVIRGDYLRRANGAPTELERAEQRLAARDRARRIVETNPRLALEMGIGRPDLKRSEDTGLVDVNHAPQTVLRQLPRVDAALAKRIAEVRDEVDGFESLEDLGMTLDLPGDVVEDLRERAVFIPR